MISLLFRPIFSIAKLFFPTNTLKRKLKKQRLRNNTALLHEKKIAAGHRRLKTLAQIGATKGLPAQLNYLRKVDALVFEEMLLSAIESKSHHVVRNERYTGDGGVDGAFFLKDKRILIQAKRYAGYIRASDVHSFSILCKQYNTRGIFVHTGRTGADAYLAAGEHVEIISGEKVLSLLLPSGAGKPGA